MLPAKNRLSSFLILELLGSGQRFHGKYLSLYIARSLEKKNNSYFAFLVPKKITKQVVEKNKMKRKVKAAVKQNLEQIKKGYNVLFLVKENINSETHRTIKAEVEELLKQAGLFQCF